MKIGERKYGAASCQIRFCEGVPDHLKQDVREITDLYVDPKMRRKGQATELITRICKEADSKKMILVLRPGAFGDGEMSDRYLHEWYCTTFGFNELQQEPVILLARMFNIFQPPVEPANNSLIITGA